MFKLIRKLYDWMGSKVSSPHATAWLSALFFIEAIFFFPVDPLLILYCINDQRRSLWFATIATLSSVLGGIGGYLLGALAWESVGQTLVTWVLTPEVFARAAGKYRLYQNYAVLIAGFTPLPYKAITLSAGFCKLPLLPFIICSLVARGARFFLLAGTILIWGEKIQRFIDRSFNLLVVLFSLIVGLSMWLLGH